MSAPTPDQLEALLDDIAALAPKLGREYRWLQPDAYRRPQRTAKEEGGTGRSASRRCGRCGGSGRVCERCYGRLSGDGICPNGQCADAGREACPECDGDGALMASHDTVGGLVLSTARFREQLERAAENVAEARRRLLTAQVALNEATKLLEPAPATDRHERSLPHPADQGDLARARAAQERRQQRAQGVPVERGMARAWVKGKPVEEPLRPGGAAASWDEVTG